MTKDVLISISGLQIAVNEMENGEDEPIEVFSAGNYFFKNGKHYVRFEEVAEGVSGVTKTQIKWQGTEVLEVLKRGSFNTYMIFEKNKKNICYYDTPYGKLHFGIFMTDMMVSENEDKISIKAEYTLDVDCEPIADCAICIQIQPRDAKCILVQ